MNVIFTCGGTGGHINPAIAVANAWKERHPDSKILFIGAEDEMEEKLVPQAGFEIVTFFGAGMERSLSFRALRHNVIVIRRLIENIRQCKKIIRDFQADVIVGTGGYASFPALMAGTLLKVPTCVHESNAMPGLTTRMIADRADRVLICFPESAKHYRHPEKAEVVGMPVRREFIYMKKDEARRALGLDERPLVVSAFGSQGARDMNLAMAQMFRLEQEADFPFQHIHAVGAFGWEWMPEHVRKLGIDPEKTGSIDMRRYIYNMPEVMTAADVIISRAGSASCNEIAATGTPCILIPSPNVTDNHQEKNARALEAQGGAVVVLEKDCTAERLMEEVTSLLEDGERRRKMSAALQKMVILDSAERICTIMEELAANRRQRR